MEADQEQLEAIQKKTERVKAMHVFTAPCRPGLLVFYVETVNKQRMKKLLEHLRAD
jgi:hypothetical protein